jgi:hypothetical protein
MPDTSEQLDLLQASLNDLIGRYRMILTVRSNSRDGSEVEAIIGELLDLLDGPDWRATAELRHAVFGLAVASEGPEHLDLRRLQPQRSRTELPAERLRQSRRVRP